MSEIAPCAINLFTGEGLPACWERCPLRRRMEGYVATTGITRAGIETMEAFAQDADPETRVFGDEALRQTHRHFEAWMKAWNVAHPDDQVEIEDCVQIPGATFPEY